MTKFKGWSLTRYVLKTSPQKAQAETTAMKLAVFIFIQKQSQHREQKQANSKNAGKHLLKQNNRQEKNKKTELGEVGLLGPHPTQKHPKPKPTKTLKKKKYNKNH